MSKQGYLGNEGAQAQLRAREKDRLRQQDEDLRDVMATNEGRRLVWRIISHITGTFGVSFSGDSGHTAFNEGRRSVGVELMAEAQRVSPTDYVHMLNEQLRAQEVDALQRKKAEGLPETE